MAKYDYIIIELPQTDSRIGSRTKYKGMLRFDTSLGVLGMVEGEIQGGTLLVVHPGAHIRANIATQYVFVAGNVEGNIKASDGLYLYSGARVRGVMESRLIRMQPGVDFEGGCNLLKKESIDIFSCTRDEFRARLADRISHGEVSFSS